MRPDEITQELVDILDRDAGKKHSLEGQVLRTLAKILTAYEVLRQGGMMKYEEIKRAIDGLHAYDGGAVDSGVHDESLRARLQSHIEGLARSDRRRLLSRVMRDLCLSDEALDSGYGWEDARSLADWFDDNFGVG